MKIATTLVLILSTLFLLGCTPSPQLCSTPYILFEDSCCLDADADRTCDPSQEIPPSEPSSPTLVRLLPADPLPDVESSSSAPPSAQPLLDDLYAGTLDTKVTFVFFGDFQDTFSSQFYVDVLPTLIEQYGDYVTFIYKFYATPDHPLAKNAAEALYCARDQDKGLAYLDVLYRSYGKVGSGYLKTYAEDLGLNMDDFLLCLESNQYDDTVLEDIDEALDAGVSSPPTFFLNGNKIVGYHSLTDFKPVFDELLKFELAKIADHTVHVTASSVGKGNIILLGPTVTNPSKSQSPFSNVVDYAEFTLSVDADDVLLYGDIPQDSATLTGLITLKQIEPLGNIIYTLKFTGIKDSDAVRTNDYIYGTTGFGTSLLPRTFARLFVQGYVDVYDEHLTLLAAHQPFEYAVTHGMRENSLYTSTVDKNDLEAYLYLPGIYVDASHPFPSSAGFLYLFSEQVTYKES